jgi:hypothetical protein
VRWLAAALALLLVVACSPEPAPAPTAEIATPAPDAAPPPADAAPTPPPAVDPATAWENRLGNLPPDAAAVIRRVEACNHFSGEVSGDGSGRDRAVAAKMVELHCDAIESDTVALRAMYGDRPDVMEALDMAIEGVH